MSDLLKNNPAALRHCLLYEFLRVKAVEGRTNEKLSIFAKYNNFCEVIGDDVMKYSEFEFWFYRFANGEFDLNYERDKDKKIYELMDMPVDVMENIVEHLDIFDRTKLAKTSRSLQTFVEDQKLFHGTLKLTVLDGLTTVSFGKSVNIQYERNYAGCKKYFESRVTLVQGVPYWKQAFMDLKSILKNPKLHLDTLEIESRVFNGNVSNDFDDTLNFTRYLNVKNLIIEENALGKIPNIIPSLKPGYLSTIKIDICYPEGDSMEKVFEMEQWKQAKCFTMGKSCYRWPPRHLYHFKEFRVTVKQLSVEDIREMKEVLFKSPDFEKCSLALFGYGRVIDKLIFEKELGDALRKDPYIYHYPIQNSAEYFEITVIGRRFEVTRKKN